jgi:hypothetical protein
MDVVPVDPHGPGRHADVVRGSVRRFFQRADPEHRGTVSEERFRAFLRCGNIPRIFSDMTELW